MNETHTWMGSWRSARLLAIIFLVLVPVNFVLGNFMVASLELMLAATWEMLAREVRKNQEPTE